MWCGREEMRTCYLQKCMIFGVGGWGGGADYQHKQGLLLKVSD
jgi:hypothetical protein